MTSKECMGSQAMAMAAVGAVLMREAVSFGVEQGIRLGIKAAMDYLAEERAKSKKSRYDRRLHNTRLLLKNYRLFKQHAAGAIFNAKQVKESAVDILDGLDDTMITDHAYVEGIKKSQQRTVVILHHVDEMLRFYKISCEQSQKPEDMRRYRVIFSMYIDDRKLTAQQIAEKECVDDRTIYKDISAAVKPLSALIFGIDGTNME